MASSWKGDLKHPEMQEQWPHILANKLNIPDVINDALWNGSNERTFRKLDQFLKSHTGDLDKVLFIIQFTFPWRYEMWSDNIQEDYTWEQAPDDVKENWIRLNPGWADIEKPFDPDGVDNSVALVHHKVSKQLTYQGRIKAYGRAVDWNNETEYQTAVRQCLAVDNLLKIHNAHRRYMFGDILRQDTEARVKELIPGFLNNFYVCTSIPEEMKTIDGYHPDYQGNVYFADLLAEELLPTLTEKTVQNH
jgi:hypothetical protein